MEGNNPVDQAIQILEDCGQQEELVSFLRDTAKGEDQRSMAEQIVKLNAVTPTGMKAYLERGRSLMERSRLGVNPFE